ncbi:MAG: hypothetical protein LBP25_03410 [Tannerellaceae bacterium]|jgi:hypothetical protein|nr:hypothetical protein [Tannerellaceae bacterium]
MKKTTIITLLLILCLPFRTPEAAAQHDSPATFKNTLAIQPLYWLNNGIRIDYERQLKNPSHWLQISGIGYYLMDSENFWTLWNYDDLNDAWGAGMEVNYKYFPFGRIWYLSAGLSAAHFSVQYSTEHFTYISYEQEGLTYYEPRWENVEESQQFERFGTNLCVGIQTRPSRRFLLDFYTGAGRVFSLYDEDKRYPDKYLNSLSYRGITLTMGVRIGFRL